ncbi:hypothetical protein DW159_02790 [Coprococcus sp. AM14-16]|uniref:hypothetical protein n=1 Tax=Coprococcus TaxID=33042 RepID=UPI000E42503C|nr:MULTISPECIES: hypothetical protein [Coprococcus]RGD40944.1 hypothetical protein DW159_02790 [Coprococcus sp. AM14-16]
MNKKIKKTIVFSTIAVTAMVLCSCGNSEMINDNSAEQTVTETNDATDSLSEETSDLTVSQPGETEQEKDEIMQYRISKIFSYDENDVMYMTTLFEYDDNGNLILKDNLVSGENEGERYTEYEYDDNGNCISETSYLAGDENRPCMIYEYDSQNRKIKEYDSNYPDVYTAYEYDDNDNVVKETYCKENGNKIDFWTDYSYDAQQNLIQSDFFLSKSYSDGNGEFYDSTITYYLYDENGNEIKKESTVYDENGNMTSTSLVVSEYDGYNNVTNKQTYENDSLKYTDQWEYIYDDYGNAISKKENFNGKTTRTEIEYEAY